MRASHEYNSKGWHRIVAVSGGKRAEGEFTSYQGIAALNAWGKQLMAVSGYHAGGALVPEQVYEVKAVRE